MKKILAVVFLSALIFPAFITHAAVRVRSYYKPSTGSYIQTHYRSSPNSYRYDNYSSKGNYNPYSGKKGHRNYYAW